MLTINKEQLENPCKDCGKGDKGPLCCNYITLPAPRYDKEYLCYDSVYWFLTRKNVRVDAYLDAEGKPSDKAEKWDIVIQEKCQFLGNEGLCTIYEKRPNVCSDYSPFPLRDVKDVEDSKFCERFVKERYKMASFNDPFVFADYVKKHFGFDQLTKRNKLEYDLSQLNITDTIK